VASDYAARLTHQNGMAPKPSETWPKWHRSGDKRARLEHAGFDLLQQSIDEILRHCRIEQPQWRAGMVQITSVD
jgi:hypothetical protein